MREKKTGSKARAILTAAFQYLAGAGLGFASASNSEVFWGIAGKNAVLVGGAAMLMGASVLLVLSTPVRFVILARPLSILSGILFILSCYWSSLLVFEIVGIAELSKALFGVTFIAILSTVRFDERSLNRFVKGYASSIFAALAIILALQGTQDSSGNVAALAIMASFLVHQRVNKILGFFLTAALLVLCVLTIARMGVILSIVSLALMAAPRVSRILLPAAKRSGAALLARFASLILFIFLFSGCVFIARVAPHSKRWNELLTYRPILWNNVLVVSMEEGNLFLPADLFTDMPHRNGVEVYRYHGWQSEVKSYSSHSILFENISRWSVMGGLLIMIFVLTTYFLTNGYLAWGGFTLSLLNGLGASVTLGTPNMFGVFLSICFMISGMPRTKENEWRARDE